MHNQFLTIYDRYFNDVYRYVYVKTGNKWDAEDIVSETFRKAYEKIHSLKNDSNPKSRLRLIAINHQIHSLMWQDDQFMLLNRFDPTAKTK